MNSQRFDSLHESLVMHIVESELAFIMKDSSVGIAIKEHVFPQQVGI